MKQSKKGHACGEEGAPPEGFVVLGCLGVGTRPTSLHYLWRKVSFFALFVSLPVEPLTEKMKNAFGINGPFFTFSVI